MNQRSHARSGAGSGPRQLRLGPRSGTRVAIVEDEGIVAMYLQSLLTTWGYDVVAIMSSGEDALAFTVETPPDLVLMDIQLRGEMDGIEAALAIRTTLDLPVVFLTAYSDDATLSRVGSTEPYGFVRKPFDERDLRIAVEMAIFRHRADVTLRQRRDWLDATLSSVSDGVIATDRDGRIMFANPAAERLTGWSRTQTFDHELSDVMRPAPGDAGPSASDVVRGVLGSGGEVVEGPAFTLARSDGTEVTLELRAAPIKIPPDEVVGSVLLFHDVSERRRHEEQLVRLAHHDPLTGLPTRLMFEERLGQALDQSRRIGRPVGVVVLDLDRFKEVNDGLGHAAGDRLLAAAADRIVGSLRRSDTAARIGGDEIAIVLPDLETAAGAVRVAEKLVEAFGLPFTIDGHELVATISAGVSVFPRDAPDSGELFERADEALYRAKQAGRNRAVAHHELADSTGEPARMLERDLREALDRGDLEVHYQPIFALPSRRLAGAEALVRWRHADYGLISAADFLGTASRSGLVTPITDRTVESACAQAAGWGFHNSDLTIAVNLNDSQLLRRDLVSTVQAAIARSRLDPGRLQLEVAERVVVDRPSTVTAANLDGLRRLGAKVTLDGFGSFQAAMVSLRRLRLDLLKIDRCLVSGVPDDPAACAIVEGAFLSARRIGIATSAGGVEDDRQLRWLEAHHCQFAQGYLLGAACPAAEFERRFLT
jgi:diguanylate cyclase (GGDEF)-like protein/PAS domain S-box-containing protein